MDNQLTAFLAKRIITMNPSLPDAECVVLRGNKILATGPRSILSSYPLVQINNKYADKVIVPGFVEGHCHAMEGAVWKYLYLGYFPRVDPHNELKAGVTSYEQLAQQLRQADLAQTDTAPLICWGFDPIYFPNSRLDRKDLDEACPNRPVVIIHANFHLMTVNTAMLEKIGMASLENTEGVLKDEFGYPNGELQEMAAMGLVFKLLEDNVFDVAEDQEALELFAKSANNKGITTITDLFNRWRFRNAEENEQ